jgi:hypothetical protein
MVHQPFEEIWLNDPKRNLISLQRPSCSAGQLGEKESNSTDLLK